MKTERSPALGSKPGGISKVQTKDSTGEFRREWLPSPEDYYTDALDKLHRRGEWADAVCVFHDDRDPSLSVNLTDGGFQCHGCGASGGDVLDFHRMHTGLSFIEAAKDLGAWDQSERVAPIESARRRAVSRQVDAKPTGTKLYALELWLAADPFSVASHPYAIAKGIEWAAGAARGKASGRVIGRNADCLIVPIRDLSTGRVVAVQAINTEGKKQTFGSIKGHGLPLGNTLDKSLPFYVCEGWASAVSMVFHHQKGNGVCFAAFGKNNLDTLAHRIADVYAPDEIVILREVDQ